MKHCKNCEYCRLDLVTQYVQGLKLYKCDTTGKTIEDPFWEKCECYKRDSFSSDNFGKKIIDWLHR